MIAADAPAIWIPPAPAIIRPAEYALLRPGAFRPMNRAERRATVADLVRTKRLTPAQAERAMLLVPAVGWAAGAPVVTTYLSSNAVASGGTSKTWSSVTLGTAYTHFVVAIGHISGSGANRTITSVTVAGSAATELVQEHAAFTGISLWIIALSSASGDIVASADGSVSQGYAYGLWGLTGLVSTTADSTDNQNDASADTPIACALSTTQAGGTAFAAATIWDMPAGAGANWTGDISGRDFAVYWGSAPFPGISAKAIATTGDSLSFSSPDPGSSGATNTAVAAALR